MCWVSTLTPEEDELDVFANLADEEEDSNIWDSKGDMVRAIVSRVSDVSASNSSDARVCAASPVGSHSCTFSESGSDCSSRALMMVCDVNTAFFDSCKTAEEWHWIEMKGWNSTGQMRCFSLFVLFISL